MLINTLRIDSKTCYSLLKHVAIFVTHRKDNVSECNESSLSNCRVQLIFCKDSKKLYWLFQKKY